MLEVQLTVHAHADMPAADACPNSHLRNNNNDGNFNHNDHSKTFNNSIINNYCSSIDNEIDNDNDIYPDVSNNYHPYDDAHNYRAAAD